mgnify:CR=1 FL=1
MLSLWVTIMLLRDIEITEEFIDKMLSSLSDGVCILSAQDPKHPIIYVNPAFEVMSGYSQEEVLAKPGLFLNHTDSDASELEALYTALLKGESCHVTLRNMRHNGELFWNEMTLSAIKDKNDKTLYFISTQKDISDDIHLQKTITDQIKALESAKQRLEGLAKTDSLTGLFNKRYFSLQYPTQHSIAKRNNDDLSVFMIDVDHFKQYNDHYGHLAGDYCLKEISSALKNVFKRSSDFIARFGGEEFVVYSVGLNKDQAIVSANNLLEYMKDLKISHEKSDINHVTLSIGISSTNWDKYSSPTELIEQADMALYHAKNGGRNKTVVYQPS